MKHQNEKHSKQIMRFFTPDLYLGFNSPNDEEADAANEEWETAIEQYEAHLEKLRGQMPIPVRNLADSCFHDAELLACDEVTERFTSFPADGTPILPVWSRVAIVSLAKDNKITNLIYALWDHLRKYDENEEWRFSGEHTHWLYDEVDISPELGPGFLHRILMSNGQVVEIPFTSVLIHSFAARLQALVS